MAHEVFNNKFYSHRQPAWHGLGLVLDEPLKAVEAFERVGVYNVEMQPLQTADGLAAPAQAIVRLGDPLQDATVDGVDTKDPDLVLGVVGPEYKLIQPMRACEIWDEVVQRTVETLGVLREGKVMFMTTQLPTASVKGDEITRHLVLMNPMNGLNSIEVLNTDVRVVCMNTLVVARTRAGELYKIVHDENAEVHMHGWLEGVYDKAVARAEMLSEAYEALASYRVNGPELDRILGDTYPYPKGPRENAPAEVMAVRNKNWETVCEQFGKKRGLARELFEGKGTGMDTTAAAGTAWGAWNAVVELEDNYHRRASVGCAESALVGTRAEAKARAFEATCEVAGVKLN